jgi:hypothetical protein
MEKVTHIYINTETGHSERIRKADLKYWQDQIKTHALDGVVVSLKAACAANELYDALRDAHDLMLEQAKGVKYPTIQFIEGVLRKVDPDFDKPEPPDPETKVFSAMQEGKEDFDDRD